MSRTILDPQYANDLTGLFNGTTAIDVSTIDANVVSISGSGSTSAPSLSTNSANNLVVSTTPTSGLTISNANGNTTLQQEVGYLECSSTLDAPILQISGGGATTKPFISTNSANSFVVSTATGAGLTLSNASGAFGLVPQPGYLASSGTLDAPIIQISGGGATVKPFISTNSANNFVVSTPNSSGITISTPAGNGTLSVNSSNQLLWNGAVIS